VICPACGSHNEAGRKFCGECGASLALACPACGAPNAPGVKFCGECGTRMSAAAPAAPAAAPERAGPVAERRLVSVLFADLVGFTTLSERRDAEEVRELLSRYFETSRRLIERYGGTVEKFIGDAVMAVWGAPVANEDDAERAVRTALDLVAAVSALGDELAAPGLRLRAGVLTGEAAVTLGAHGQGMVAGDLVNSASRVQSRAEPGTVLVGEATRRASAAAIAYEDAGRHEVKGRDEPLRLFRALRVIAARRGEGRALGLESPLIGRDREVHLIKELFHATAEEHRARLVSVVGLAGTGKSRLAWEFEKYIDGLADTVYWHRGRCLAYGEGVAFWALAEMVRMRARIAEDDPPGTALGKLRETLAGEVPEPAEREFLEPRLAHLLGLADRMAPDKEDLFSAWRLFFERMAARHSVVLLFEDLQWADEGLLDFVEYLLDWSRAHPIYVLTLARPDLIERRAGWGAGRRDFTSLFLEPLAAAEIEALLAGLVPGLPRELRDRIVERSEGVPLYAVETVRMLIDRGLLVREGDEYRPSGAVELLDVPETLQGLVAARLDGLEPAERRLVEDAAVLGRMFTRAGLAALSGRDEAGLEPLVASLLRKEILTVQTEPLSPERGQLAFVQDLLRRVAYDTLSLRERKARHLAAAAHFEREWAGEESEIVAVLAAHYLDAYRAGPGDADSDELRRRARERLEQAAERAASLAANEEARGYYEQAAQLAETALGRAGLLERAGRAGIQSGAFEEAMRRFTEASGILEEEGEQAAAAWVAARAAVGLSFIGGMGEALERMRSAYDSLRAQPASADLAYVAAERGRLATFAGDHHTGSEMIEQALDLAESLDLPEVLAEALVTKGVLLWRRPHEAQALTREGLAIALEHGLIASALRAQYNLSGLLMEYNRFGDARTVLDESLALARRRGDRSFEARLLTQLAEVLVNLSEWDAALACLADAPENLHTETLTLTASLASVSRVGAARGAPARARELVDAHPSLRTSADVQERGAYLLADALTLHAEGRPQQAVEVGEESRSAFRSIRSAHYAGLALAEAIEAALDAGDAARAESLMREGEDLPPMERRPLLTAQLSRLRGRLAVRQGDSEAAERLFAAAAAGFRDVGDRFWTAVAQLERAEALLASGRAVEAEPDLAEARGMFEELGARPWLARADAAPVRAVVPSA
jgi:class 3 adenylate cyclase/tetratricopeptide (TPR) repeat protein